MLGRCRWRDIWIEDGGDMMVGIDEERNN